MKNLAALTAVLALAAGLAACTSSGSSTATATARATTTPVSGTETLSGKLTGSAAMSDILVFHLRLTGPVGTTATIRLGTEVPEKYELYTIHTAVGDLAVALASAGTSTGGLKSAKTCLYVLTTAVPFTVDGANSTGTFAGATGTGTAVVVTSGDDPKLSDGTCNTSRDALPSATTAAATFAATIKLTIRQSPGLPEAYEPILNRYLRTAGPHGHTPRRARTPLPGEQGLRSSGLPAEADRRSVFEPRSCCQGSGHG